MSRTPLIALVALCAPLTAALLWAARSPERPAVIACVDLDKAFSQLEQLKDQRERLQEQRSRLLDLINDLNSLKIREDAKAVIIAQPATTPRERSFPQWKVMIPLGGVVGILLIAGIAFVRERVVREPVPFVVQGGDPRSADPKVPSDQLGTGSFIDPASGEARLIPLEIRLNGDRAPRYGTPITTPGISGKLVKPHLRGSVAMARSQDPDSASSQFYVALQALPELDGSYAVFGQVISGMDVVDRLQQGDRLQRATLVEGGTLVRGKP